MKKFLSRILCILILCVYLLGCSPIVVDKGDVLEYNNKEYYNYHQHEACPNYSLMWEMIDTIQVACERPGRGYYVCMEDLDEIYLYSDTEGMHAVEGTVFPKPYESEISKLLFYNGEGNKAYESLSLKNLTLENIIDNSAMVEGIDFRYQLRIDLYIEYKGNKFLWYLFTVFKVKDMYYLSHSWSRDIFVINAEYNYLFEDKNYHYA